MAAHASIMYEELHSEFENQNAYIITMLMLQLAILDIFGHGILPKLSTAKHGRRLTLFSS